MTWILTQQEGLDALRWHMLEHPIKLGVKKSKLEIFLRALGLNQSNSRLSGEQSFNASILFLTCNVNDISISE